MSDATPTAFSAEHLAEQAQGNVTAFILTTLAYLKDRHLSPDDYVTYVGQRFAASWDELQGRPVTEITRMAALNVVSAGAVLHALSGDDTQAEAVVTGWPSEEWCAAVGLTLDDLDPFWNIYAPIADYLGLAYSWQRHGEAVTLRFTRTRADA